MVTRSVVRQGNEETTKKAPRGYVWTDSRPVSLLFGMRISFCRGGPVVGIGG